MSTLSERELNCLSYWYPKIQGYVPTPETRIVRYDGPTLVNLFDPPDRRQTGFDDEFGKFMAELRGVAGNFDLPLFLRTGQTSGKHEWDRCCHVTDVEKLAQHVCCLVAFSEMVDFIGLPTNVWVVREMLDVEPLLVCDLYGNMPVVQEFRFFVDGATVLYRNDYWPDDALKDGCSDWESVKVRAADRVLVTDRDEQRMLDLASSCGDAVGGRWSVDILRARDGWYVTDMAVAEMSYGWDEQRAEAGRRQWQS